MSILSRRPITLTRVLLPLIAFVWGSVLLQEPTTGLSQTQGTESQSAASARPAATSNAPQPSLDVLKARVNSYWNLLARARKTEALQYVDPSRQADFKAWPMPPFSEPRIASMTFSQKAGEVLVTVEVKRVLPPPMPGTPVSWPVTQTWVFRNGAWFVLAENPAATPFPSVSGRTVTLPPSPAEIEKRQKAIQNALRFETSNMEFGTVRRGEDVSLSIGYSLAGTEAFGFFFKDFPDDFYVRNPAGKELPPGNGQKIQAGFLTKDCAGEVNEKLSAIVSHQGAEVPYEFTLHGFVYTPVYATPMTLKFLSGEHEKEVLVRNISKSEVVITGDISNNDYNVAPLPQTLPPGGNCTLKVSIVRDRDEQNHIDSLFLSFDKPVEGLAGLDLAVVRNYQEVHQKTREEELQELLKKSGVPIKK